MNQAAIPRYLQTMLPAGQLPPHLPGFHLPWVRHAREKALAQFVAQGLPTASNPAWHYTNLASIEKKIFQFRQPNPQSHEKPFSISPVLGPVLGKAALQCVFLDGVLQPPTQPLPAGLRLLGLRDALAAKAAGIETAFASPGGAASWHGLNAALCEDGLVVEVADGVALETPLEIILATSATPAPHSSHLRHQLRLGSGAKLRLLWRVVGGGEDGFNTQHTTYQLGAGAMLENVWLQNAAPQTTQFFYDHAMLAENANFNNFIAHIGGNLTHHQITIMLQGEGAAAQLHGLNAVDGTAHTALATHVAHQAAHTSSTQRLHSMAAGSGRAVFHGLIAVAQAAQKTAAAQQHHGLLLSDRAEIDATPSLAIYADDVTCSHGATCGALDEEALFYLQSRGIGRDAAANLLLEGFIQVLFEGIENPALREAVLSQLNQHLHSIKVNP